jgi:hypothetical protein
MASMLLLNFLDFARCFGASPLMTRPEEIAEWLLCEYIRRAGGGFNYNPAIQTLSELFRGSMRELDAIRYCETTGNPKGRSQNVEAIKTVAQYALSNISTCYRIGFSAVAVGRTKGQTVYIAVKAPLVRVVRGEAFVVMPGFRRSYRPSDSQIDVACSLALATFARDDFAGADFEYLHAGPNSSGEREFRAYLGRDRRVFDRNEVDALLDKYVRAITLLMEMGVQVKQPNLTGYRIIDPGQSSFPW